MALVKNEPFLKYLLDYILPFGINRVILSVGYKHEAISDYFGNKYKTAELVYAIENEPLGTGGGIANALTFAKNKSAFLLNGDTFFKVDLSELYQFHIHNSAELTLALKPMKQFDRYGTVQENNGRISKFIDKQYVENGLINGGVYVINKAVLADGFPQKFSFEKDFL